MPHVAAPVPLLTLPAAHALHIAAASAPTAALYLPSGHASQWDASEVLEPSPPYRPPGQGVHDGALSPLHVPFAHNVHDPDPALAHSPAAHESQNVRKVLDSLPAVQVVQVACPAVE